MCCVYLVILPLLNGIKPNIAFSKVVLPAPFGPIRPMNSPEWMQNDTFSITVSGPKTTDRLSTSIKSFLLTCKGCSELGEVFPLDAEIVFALFLVCIGYSFYRV